MASTDSVGFSVMAVPVAPPAMLSQAITFGSAPPVSVGGTGTVSATGGASGNPVTFTSTTPGICKVSGSTVTGVSAGACTIAANQAGNANYNAASQATQTFSVAKGNQTIAQSECLCHWAEKNYPRLFAPAGCTPKVSGVYTYCYYSATKSYLYVSSLDNRVYYQGPDGKMLDEGPRSNWMSQARCQ